MEDALLVTICSGVVVGIIVLFIEYKYFQRRQQRRPNSPNRTWAEATKRAIKRFRDYSTYRVSDVEVVEMKIDKGKAVLDGYEIHGSLTMHPERRRHFLLTIDRTGDILGIEQIATEGEAHQKP